MRDAGVTEFSRPVQQRPVMPGAAAFRMISKRGGEWGGGGGHVPISSVDATKIHNCVISNEGGVAAAHRTLHAHAAASGSGRILQNTKVRSMSRR
jgi:hypothetical protein